MRSVHLLVQAGAVFDNSSEAANQVLACAADNQRVDVLKALLELGVNPDASSKEGETALFYAASTGASESVKLLIEIMEAGVYIRVADSKGRKILELSIRSKAFGIIQHLLQIQDRCVASHPPVLSFTSKDIGQALQSFFTSKRYDAEEYRKRFVQRVGESRAVGKEALSDLRDRVMGKKWDSPEKEAWENLYDHFLDAKVFQQKHQQGRRKELEALWVTQGAIISPEDEDIYEIESKASVRGKIVTAELEQWLDKSQNHGSLG
jgi:hypothetical protein